MHFEYVSDDNLASSIDERRKQLIDEECRGIFKVTAKWAFDPPPPSGKQSGGSAAEYGFKGRIDTLVRETLQNSMDAVLDKSKPVEVKYRLIELSGSLLEEFLQSMGWTELEEHLRSLSAERSGGEEILSALRRFNRLDEQSEEPKLRILIIEDRNTRGLGGNEERRENDEKNPYRSLAFDELFSDKADPNAGGSYGLGKVMLWVFSAFKTVLFASVPESPPGAHHGLRFIARASLPAHWIDERQFTGDGWLGAPGDGRSYSLWGAEARDLATNLYCDRSDHEYGTSIVVVGFYEPDDEAGERDLNDLAHAISESAVESFWPAMSMGRVKVSVDVEVHGKTRLSLQVDPTTEKGYQTVFSLYEQFKRGEVEIVDRLKDAGEAGCKEVSLRVPARENPRSSAHDSFEIRFPVIVRLLTEAEVDERIADRVFRFRNQGMLVGRDRKDNLSVTARPYVAILPAGLAAGNSVEHARADSFLRDAEPQEHDRWAGNTKAIRNHFKKGSVSAIADFESSIRSAIKSMVSIPERPGGSVPEHIRKLMKFGNTGVTDEDQFIKISSASASPGRMGWVFGFSCRRCVEVEKSWTVRVRLLLVSDGGKKENSNAIKKVECEEAEDIKYVRGAALIRLSRKVDRIRVTGETDPEKFSRQSRQAPIDLSVDGWEEVSSNA